MAGTIRRYRCAPSQSSSHSRCPSPRPDASKITYPPFAERRKQDLWIAHLEIARLGRCNRREQRPIGLEVEQWRSIQAIQAAYRHDPTLDRNQLGDGGADWIWPGGRPQ